MYLHTGEANSFHIESKDRDIFSTTASWFLHDADGDFHKRIFISSLDPHHEVYCCRLSHLLGRCVH
jgi:hypothetical protein